ncbi:MAG: ferredoxin--NADP reductase [Thermoanaerobaculum sp.]|nr:ferredoxin--NADP reductase [Thermoanaerobaculum sp.]
MANSADPRNAVLIWREDVAPGLAVFRVAPEGWELPPFEPGQFAVLGLPAEAPRVAGSLPEEPPPKPGSLIRRAYSIASSSRQRQYLEFYLALVRSGSLTPRLFALNVGEKLWLSPKFSGLFTLKHVPPTANLVLVGTGTGLAPYMSMLRTHLVEDSRRKTAVIHGARHASDLGYRNELEALEREFAHLSYIPVVSRPQQELHPWVGETGYVQDVWRRRVVAQKWGFAPSPEHTHVLLCGNPTMVENMMELLKEEGFRPHTAKQPGQIHTEKYW